MFKLFLFKFFIFSWGVWSLEKLYELFDILKLGGVRSYGFKC